MGRKVRAGRTRGRGLGARDRQEGNRSGDRGSSEGGCLKRMLHPRLFMRSLYLLSSVEEEISKIEW